jgi:hypothetical protein
MMRKTLGSAVAILVLAAPRIFRLGARFGF